MNYVFPSDMTKKEKIAFLAFLAFIDAGLLLIAVLLIILAI